MKEKLLEIKKIIDELLTIKLEPKNLKINSNDWIKHTNENGQEYLENPEGDVWEHKGKQYFTWDGAMREVKKLGKRLPTDKEMKKLEKKDYGEVEYAGYRGTDGSFYNLDAGENFWSSTESGTSAWIRYLYSSLTTVGRNTLNKTYGFSVRCVQE